MLKIKDDWFNIYFCMKKGKAEPISKGTKGLSPLGEAANLDLLFQKHFR